MLAEEILKFPGKHCGVDGYICKPCRKQILKAEMKSTDSSYQTVKLQHRGVSSVHITDETSQKRSLNFVQINQPDKNGPDCPSNTEKNHFNIEALDCSPHVRSNEFNYCFKILPDDVIIYQFLFIWIQKI